MSSAAKHSLFPNTVNVVVLDQSGRSTGWVRRPSCAGGLSLSIEAGVFMAIAGPSGSGKSTLLNVIGCIDQPTAGRVCVGGMEVAGKNTG